MPRLYLATPVVEDPSSLVASLPALTAALTEGHPPARRVLAELGAMQVRFDDPAAFENVNTRADLRDSDGAAALP